MGVASGGAFSGHCGIRLLSVACPFHFLSSSVSQWESTLFNFIKFLLFKNHVPHYIRIFMKAIFVFYTFDPMPDSVPDTHKNVCIRCVLKEVGREEAVRFS